jgi:hypothetical protein
MRPRPSRAHSARKSGSAVALGQHLVEIALMGAVGNDDLDAVFGGERLRELAVLGLEVSGEPVDGPFLFRLGDDLVPGLDEQGGVGGGQPGRARARARAATVARSMRVTGGVS